MNYNCPFCKKIIKDGFNNSSCEHCYGIYEFIEDEPYMKSSNAKYTHTESANQLEYSWWWDDKGTHEPWGEEIFSGTQLTKISSKDIDESKGNIFKAMQRVYKGIAVVEEENANKSDDFYYEVLLIDSEKLSSYFKNTIWYQEIDKAYNAYNAYITKRRKYY